MTPYISRAVPLVKLIAAYTRWAPSLLPLLLNAGGDTARVLYSVEGDGIVVSHRAIWTDQFGFMTNIECPALVGLNLLAPEEIQDIRKEWWEKRKRYEALRCWLEGAAAETQTEFGDV